jgi:DNA-binding response OmpR family regulator
MRVLVVEDEVKMAGLLRRALEEEGYAVDVAAGGDDGLWLGTENPYDAIVLDLMLPGLDGAPSSCSRRATQWPIESRGWTPAPTTT